MRLGLLGICRLALVCLGLLLVVPVQAGVVLPADRGHVDLNGHVTYFEDANQALNVFAVLGLSPAQWQPSPKDVLNLGYGDSTWWIQVTIDNHSGQAEWYLDIGYGVLDYVNVYVINPQGQLLETHQLGDKLPFDSRPLNHRTFVVPLVVPNAKATILLQVRSSSSVQVPLSLWRPAEFASAATQAAVLNGAFYGALLVIAIYNFLLFFPLRDRVYLLYVAYVVCMCLFSASMNGWTYQYFWPHATQWNDTAIVFFLALTLALGSWFCTAFLGVRSRSRLILSHQKLLTGGSFGLACLFLTMPYGTSIKLVIALAGYTCLWGWALGVYAWWRGWPGARYYVLSWGMLLGAAIVLALSKAGVIPSNLATEYALQLGTVLENVLLSFALAERINYERAMRHKAQQDTLAAQVQARKDLEIQVGLRTQELEAANRKLQAMSDTDALTQLSNRRSFDLAFQQQLIDSQERQEPLALLLIDIDHFKMVNDTHGHLAGDECLQDVAQRIQRQLTRTEDLAARFGGEEFCVLLPATDSAGALQVADRIRHAIEAEPVSTRVGPLTVTASLGVFSQIAAAELPAEAYIAAADGALYEAKARGRNRALLAANTLSLDSSEWREDSA